MKLKLFISLLVLQTSFQALAMEITSAQAKDDKGVYRIATVIQCTDAADDSCMKICGDQQTCSRPEPTCVNCAGTANEMIRILFTRLESFYQPSTERLAAEELVQFLTTQKYVLLSHESVYNFHRTWGAPETLALFQSFCAEPTTAPLLLLQLDSIGQPQELKGVICQDQNGSYAQRVEARSAATESLNLKLRMYLK